MLSAALRYVLFALLALVGPGLFVHRVFRLRVDPALVLPLGTALTAGAYWLSLVLELPWLFPLLVAALDLALLLPRGPWLVAHGPSLRGAVAPFLTLVVLFAITQYRWNRVGPSGEFLLDNLVPFDTAFHVGLTRELTIGYPPQVPGVSGFPLGYHVGTDLVRAAALRWAKIDPYDSISRFDLTLGALALVLVLSAVTLRAGASPLAAAIVPWTLLATDFSFIFAGSPSAIWWADLLRGNLLLSLALANPVVPGLALTLGSLIAFSRYEAGEGRGWLVLAAVQALAVPFFKVFLGAHLLLGLSLAMLLRTRPRVRALGVLAAPCALATAALVFGQGGQTLEVSLAPLDLVRITRDSLGLTPLSGAALGLWAFLWLLPSLGLRFLGLPAALSALRKGPPIGAVMAVMALAAWPLGLLFRVSAPQILPGQKPFNDVYVLIEQGGPLLWIFTAMALTRMAVTPRRGTAVLAAALLLALPSTLQFAVSKALLPPDRLPAAMVRAMKALEAASDPGDVILQRPGGRYPPAPVVLIGRRVPYERFTPYLTQFASRDDLIRRHQTVYRFFHTSDPAEALAIAHALGASHLCLYGFDRVRFDGAVLETIHAEAGARCYRLPAAKISALAAVGQH